jgi:Zn-dependent protease/CBS domain-containing protein
LSVKIGEVSGIAVRLHYTWFIVLALVSFSVATDILPVGYPGESTTFYWMVGVAAALSLFASVVVHEVAHSLVSQRLGIKVRSITLYFLGGVSEATREPGDPLGELLMAGAGPLSSLVIGLTTLGAYRLGSGSLPVSVIALLQYVSLMNISLAAFNMIPAYPMDGGRVLRAAVWKLRGNAVQATKIAVAISRTISFLFISGGILSIIFPIGINGFWLLILGFFLNSSAVEGLNETRLGEALAGVSVGDIMTQEVFTLDPEMSVQDSLEYGFWAQKHHGFPVVKDGEIIGILAESDVLAVPKEARPAKKVKEIMTPASKLVSASPEEPAMEALIRMSGAGIGRLPVTREGKLVGILSRSDYTKVIKEKFQGREAA